MDEKLVIRVSPLDRAGRGTVEALLFRKLEEQLPNGDWWSPGSIFSCPFENHGVVPAITKVVQLAVAPRTFEGAVTVVVEGRWSDIGTSAGDSVYHPSYPSGSLSRSEVEVALEDALVLEDDDERGDFPFGSDFEFSAQPEVISDALADGFPNRLSNTTLANEDTANLVIVVIGEEITVSLPSHHFTDDAKVITHLWMPRSVAPPRPISKSAMPTPSLNRLGDVFSCEGIAQMRAYYGWGALAGGELRDYLALTRQSARDLLKWYAHCAGLIAAQALSFASILGCEEQIRGVLVLGPAFNDTPQILSHSSFQRGWDEGLCDVSRDLGVPVGFLTGPDVLFLT